MNENQQQQEIHLRDIPNVIRKHKWVLITCALVSIAIGIIVIRYRIPKYQADCQIIIDKEINRSFVTGKDLDYFSYDMAYTEGLDFNTHLKIITSYQVLEKVINKLGLQDLDKSKNTDEIIEKDNFISNIKANIKATIKENMNNIMNFFERLSGSKNYTEKQISEDSSKDMPDQKMGEFLNKLRRKIEVIPVKDTRLVNIIVTDENPGWAAKIANTIATTYIEYDDSVKYKSMQGFLNWISDQIAEMKQKLNESEKQFLDFKTKNKMFSIQEKQNINTQKIAEMNASYIKFRTEIMDLDAKIFQLENILNKKTSKTLVKDIIDDPTLTILNNNIIEAQMELDALKQKYKHKHPKILHAVNRIETLQEEFDKTLKKSLKGLYMQQDILKSREKSILSAITGLEEDALATNKKESRYAMLEREVETNKAIYDILLNKLKEAKINENIKRSNIRITEPAIIPNTPITAKKTQTLMLFFILGLFCGIGLIFLLEYLETSIKTEEDVKYFLQLPVIGIIPEAAKTNKKLTTKGSIKTEFPLISNNSNSNVFSEAYRSLRTNIIHSLKNKKPSKAILVTSSIPQEGKTITITNLALTLSQTGESVLLIDTDLRMPSIDKKFKLDRNKGLTTILTDIFNIDLNEGSLEEYGIGDIINLINIQERSGILTISDHTEDFQLIFKAGELIDAQWKNRPEEERLGAILLAGRKINEEQMKKAFIQKEHCRERLGSILLNMNIINTQDLKGPLTLHFSSIMNKIASMKKGHFRFQNDYIPKIDTLDYIKDSFYSWQEIISSQSIPFLEKKIFSVIQDGSTENLKILTSGPLPSNPSELLSSNRMKILMNILKERFDYILLDSPPVNSVTDSSILAPLVDGVIQVVHIGHINRNAARKAKQQLDSIGSNILGVVLNRLNLKKDGYYCYSYYQYDRNGDYYKKPQKI